MGSSGVIDGTELKWETSEPLDLFFAGLDGGVGEFKCSLLCLRDGIEVGQLGGIMEVGAGDENLKVKASLVLPIELGRSAGPVCGG